MDEVSAILENARRVALRTGAEAIDYLPTLLGAAILLLAGWGVARLLRAATQHAGRHANRALDRDLPQRTAVRSTGCRRACWRRWPTSSSG